MEPLERLRASAGGHQRCRGGCRGQLLADTFNLIGVRQYDRKAENANKAKNRMKSYQNRGKSMQSNRLNGMFNPLKDLHNLNN